MQKKYSRPELNFIKLQLRDVLSDSGTLESTGSQVNQGGFDPDPYVDPIDEIDEIIG